MKPKSWFSKILFRAKSWRATRLWQKVKTRISKLNLAELGHIALNNNLSIIASPNEIQRLQNWTFVNGTTDYQDLITIAKVSYYPKKIETNLKSFSRQQLQAFEKNYIDEQLFSQNEKVFLLLHTNIYNKLKIEAQNLLTEKYPLSS